MRSREAQKTRLKGGSGGMVMRLLPSLAGCSLSLKTMRLIKVTGTCRIIADLPVRSF